MICKWRVNELFLLHLCSTGLADLRLTAKTALVKERLLICFTMYNITEFKIGFFFSSEKGKLCLILEKIKKINRQDELTVRTAKTSTAIKTSLTITL